MPSFDLFVRVGDLMELKLRDYITQIKACLDRGLPVTAQMVIEGLEVALDERSGAGLPIRYDVGIRYVEDRARRIRENAINRQAIGAAERLAINNRRFGQPHFGHREDGEA